MSNTTATATRHKVVVVGAGIGGLSAAIDLATRGFAVEVLERAPQVGGKMREVVVEGQGIDCGPTVLTLAHVFEDLFRDAGSELADFVTLQRLEVLARHGWVDGSRLDLFTDIDRSMDAIEDFAGAREARGFRAFCDQAERIYRALEGPFLLADRPRMGPIVRATGLGGWSFDWHRTMWRALGDYFSDPRLRQLFARYATYFGSSPFRTPGTLNLVFHVERMGVWTVKGGMFRLAEALQNLARTKGVAIHCGQSVDEIIVADGKVKGVGVSGRSIPADAVVLNAAPSMLASGHFGRACERAVGRTVEGPRSLSAFTVATRARTHGFPLLHHNVFFSADYETEFRELFERGSIPSAPTVYVCAQDRARAEAPAGDERLFMLVNAPALGDDDSFDPRSSTCVTAILRQLHACGLQVELEERASEVTTPREFEARYPTTGGALYGLATHGFRAPFQRPRARTRLRGLYLAGGGAHPGAGVPMVAMSGRIAARAVAADLGSTSTLGPVDTRGGTSTRSPATADTP